jgi:hypothetical protein
MKKTILTIATLLLSLTMYAQNGIMTVQPNAKEVPVEQWYIIVNKKLDNHAYFYAETDIAVSELEAMLFADGQSFMDPKGMDDDNDPYWVIAKESGFVTYIYFIRGKDGDIYSTIITVTN